ncbi:MAG: LytR family transcriptional regulator [Actinobacteria bacterium]|nr:MAG: LytR family transcriptional regulator [Actinomycetota bacterium]
MKTTLKRGMGRSANLNGDGRAIYPPGVHTPMRRYRQPDRQGRSAWQVVRTVVLWVILSALVVAGGAAGAAYLKTHEFIAAISPKTKADRAAAKRLDAAIPGQPTIALVIGTDRRKGFQSDLTGRSDTLILVRADPGTNSLSMLSFPRDLIVTVKCPGHPDVRDRINAAFSECGAVGSVETVRALTGLPINYFVTVNFRGFSQLVNNLGGVWVDVDHRYLCDPSTCPGVSKINLFPGYQRLNASNALAYVRYRHFDSDLFRNARQQLFLKALKQQISSQLDLSTVFSIVDAVEKNVVVGRGGNRPLDPRTLKDYVYFAHGLPSGHVFQSKIEGLTGTNELSASPQSVATAVRDFVQPDVNSPEKARDVTLGIKRRSRAPRPRDVTTTVLNGNGVAGSASNAAYELGQRGYKIVLPASGKPQNAPNFQYFRTTVYYDPAQPRSKVAGGSLANLFGDAALQPLPARFTRLANGAMATVVVGQNFHGSIAPAPIDQTPTRQPPQVTPNAALTRSLLMQVRKRVRFRLQVPRLVESSSRLEFDAPIRVYNISKGHRAVRLTFRIGSNEYWGIQETNWNDAPVLADPSFLHKIKGREYALYYAGAHLHMVVLRKDGATYWVVNSILDSLSNETMLAIAKGLAPLPK